MESSRSVSEWPLPGAANQPPATSIAGDVAFAAELYANDGPTTSDYSEVDHWLASLYSRADAGELDGAAIDTIRHAMPRAWTPETCQGRAFRKPRGYAGDFEIIDWIYCSRTSNDRRLERWDQYFHRCAAPQAVRNRKAFFKHSLAGRLEQHSKPRRLRVLDLASGPCRDVAEFLLENPHAPVEITCVDQDEDAIEYAQALCGPALNNGHAESLQFAHRNVFRYRTKTRFDWIWSAGLFDYLEDSHFCRLLSKIRRWAAPGAQIVVGNFSNQNPSRDYMRFGDWDLNHRSEHRLRQLALESGFRKENIRIEAEALGVNLFLVIDCDGKSPS